MAELSALTVTVIKFGFLALLWLFVLSAVSVMRRDLLGRGTPLAERREPAPAPAHAPPFPGPPAPPPYRPPGAGTAAGGAGGRSGRPGTLVVTAGPLAGTTLPLRDSAVTIGRGPDATLVLEDQFASGRHARLYPEDGRWLVEDLGSTNGTYLDSAKVGAPTPVAPGVPIRIGQTVLELRR